MGGGRVSSTKHQARTRRIWCARWRIASEGGLLIESVDQSMHLTGLHIKAIWEDPDLIEVVVTAANGSFSGFTCFYTSDDELRRVASALKGFPSGVADRREIRIGEAVWPDRTDGINAIFLCRDGLGHLAVEVKLTSDEHDYHARQSVTRQTVTLLLLTEPAAVDNFVTELEILADSREGSAILRVDV